MSIFRKLRLSRNLRGFNSAVGSPRITEDQMDYSHMYAQTQLNAMPGGTKISYTPGFSEVLLSKCNAVREVPYSNPVVYELGTLVLTNFKISFLRAEPNDSVTPPQVNKLVNNDDIILNNVDAIYKVSGSKRKRLSANMMVTRRIHRLEVHCKDFRIHLFNFWDEVQQDAIVMVNKILKCVFCSTSPSSTRFSARDPSVFSSSVSSDQIRFNAESDWTEVLERLGVSGFKAVHYNSAFNLTTSLPEWFVVPSSMTFADVKEFSEKFIGGVIPLWSYTHWNGASIVRMSLGLPELDKDIEHQALLHVKKSTASGKVPVVFNLTSDLPSITEISSSHSVLCQLCMPSTISQVWRTDRSWFSSIETSHWLQIILQCLTYADKIATQVDDLNHTVLLKERDGVDLVPLVASLTQLLLDPYCRTVSGFEELIDREWVALSHRFYDRYSAMSSEQSPVFLLFLDCVAHLRRQFQSDFEFSDIYLVRVWDSLCSGVFRTFAFNGVHDCQLAIRGENGRRGSSGTVRFHASVFAFHPSAWDWCVQYSDVQIALNFEPTYVVKNEDLGDHPANGNTPIAKDLTATARLKLRLKAWDIGLWSLCYLRWITPLTITQGGAASEYIAQCLLAEEIHNLRGKIAAWQSSVSISGRTERPRSVLVFGSRADEIDSDPSGDLAKWNCSLNESLPRISSSFPFVAGKQDVTRFTMSVDSCDEESSLQYEEAGEDEGFSAEATLSQSEGLVVVN